MAARRSTLDPKLDIAFWMLFGAEQNRPLLLSLLNAVLQPSVPIESVEVLHAQPERFSFDDKSIALDLRVRLVDGRQIDVEMQSFRRRALRERGLYYWARLFSGQLHRGDEYGALRPCTVILITNFKELENPRFHSIFRLTEVHSGETLTDRIELHVVELPKLSDSLDENDEPGLLAWCKFLAADSDDELETLAMANPVLKQAKEALDRLSADPEARVRAEMREMALQSYYLDMNKAREEGKDEGRTEGKAEGKAETLRKLLTIKFGELPPETAQRLFAAGEAELDRWTERLLSADSLENVLGS